MESPDPTSRPDSPPQFTPAMIGLASLLGTPWAGGILMAVNAWRRQDRTTAALVIAMGGLFSFSLIEFALPYPRSLWPAFLIISAAAMAVVGYLLGEKPPAPAVSLWKYAIVVGVAAGLASAGIAAAVGQWRSLAAVPWSSLEVRPNQLVKYAPPVSEDEARIAGHVLEAAHVFDSSGDRREVHLVRKDAATVLVLPWNSRLTEAESATQRMTSAIGMEMTRQGISRPFVIELSDPHARIQKDLVFEPLPH